ncbi:uncharacterized protein LOC119667287, partial [Teleopsis dalmanni]|uniref:uncharacterized protein LOC119667287 n=1 Tax=Teleopsis dalmanni TaxID=139649 RepID=UPI000D329688
MEIKEEDKQKIAGYLSDMFKQHSLDQILLACAEQNWNVENSIDLLINMDSKSETYAGTVKNFSMSQTATKNDQLQQGAIPKYQHNQNVRSCGSKHNYVSNANVCHTISAYETKILNTINSGVKVMVLMRGAPGSGKSTIANAIVERSVPLEGNYKLEDFVFSTDDFFYDNIGQYKWVPNRLEDAHVFNQKRVEQKAALGWSPIIVDNTNIKLWEMLPYVQTAVRHGYILEIIESRTPWSNSAGKLAMRNVHGVPRDTIQSMLLKYEKGTVNDLFKMLKTTKYSMPPPQKRTFPPLVTDKKENTAIIIDKHTVHESDTNSIAVTSSQTTPKPQRQNLKKCAIDPDNAERTQIENAPVNLRDTVTSNVWNPYEKEANKFWGIATQDQSDKSIQHADIAQVNEAIVSILKLDEKDESENNESNETDTKDTEITTFQRHSINCPKEDLSFASLRQIYPNKQVSSLWDLFTKCNGDVNWAAEILLREDELSNDINGSPPSEAQVSDSYECECVRGKVNKSMHSDTDTILIQNNIKPQRQKNKIVRNQLTQYNLQEVKQSLENCVEIKNEYYSKSMRKVRDLRNASHSNIKSHLDMGTQTDLLYDEQDEAESELLEVSLGDNLVEQLKTIFRDDFTLGETLPETVKNNVFIPRSLAKNIYMLWLESAYNHVEEQRFEVMKEDENFAALIQNPKYEHVKESPNNLRELLDMEMAWTIYNTESEKLKTDVIKVKPPDLATYLTKIKLCETFPNIPRETILDIFASHNNDYSETVEVLCSTMETQSNPLTHDELLKRVIHENELLAEKAEVQKSKLIEEREVVASVSDNNNVNCVKSKTSQQLEEAKRSALREFEECRNLAAHHSQLKAECYQKAKEAVQNNNKGVAVYYSEIANLHKKKIDMFNHIAANCIM